MVTLSVDMMGGDFAPYEQVKGVVSALNKDKELSLILCGDEKVLKSELQKYKYDESRVTFVNTTEIITMEEEPAKAVKTKKDSSIVVAFRMLKEGKADGLVSSGSTGAVLTAGVLSLGRIKGISRPALCPAMPNSRGGVTLLCDCGANLECKPNYLRDFAIMATAYAQSAYGVENPKVGLLNNGTEDHKGLPLQQETNALLRETPCVNYIGNVEGRELMFGDADVVVSDGFTGNIAMKAVEGCGKAVATSMKREFKKNIFTKLRALLVKDIIGGIKNSLDYEKVGGAVLLGLPKVVVKGHGNSKELGFSVCLQLAAEAARKDMVGKIENMVKILKEKEAESANGGENA
ncbi:MAG: phosphate acyltransferase PlsX [Clostridia bacterium]|nr:phosphate acyltransferase PlsX [Clostridia bacterium]